MHNYAVGQIIEKFIGKEEGAMFDISDSGATLMVFFNSPTADEVDQFKSGNAFELRFTSLYDIIFLTVKVGNLNWIDAPYSPHLSKELNKLEIPQKDTGLSLNLMLINSTLGKIEHMRLIGLSEHFTRKLFGTIIEDKSNPFDIREFRINLNRVFNTYSTKEIVKMSKDYFKI